MFPGSERQIADHDCGGVSERLAGAELGLSTRREMRVGWVTDKQ
jgi:hypothetical protein